MTDLELPFRALAELHVAAHTDRDKLVLSLAGTADMRVSDALDALFRQIHEHAVSTGVSRVVVDMTGLQFMNSSCFKSLVGWIVGLQGTEPVKRYRVCFLSDPEVLWQRRSLKTLSCFAPELITVSVEQH
jgi:hypothetical protein